MLEINNLSFAYNKNNNVLNNVSLKLPKGKIGIVLGKNGCGKSTLLKNILGILTPSSGTIKLDNIDLVNLKRSERAKLVSYVPQDIYFGDLNVFETILLGRISYFNYFSRYEDEQIVNEVIKELKLEHISNKNVNELSGGEKQKVAIARSLVSFPSLIIFDEPTVSLDIENEYLILNEAKKLVKSKNVTILMAIHDINLALKYGDYFYMIKDNNIKYEGNNEIINEKTIKDVFNIDVKINKVDDDKIMIVKGEEYNEKE